MNANPNRHLDRHTRGAWRMSITVLDPDPCKVGKRIKIPLKTRDLAEAQTRRDIAVEALIRAGVAARAVEIEAGDNSPC